MPAARSWGVLGPWMPIQAVHLPTMPDDTTPPAAPEHPRLDALLDNWVLYQRTGGTRHLRVATSRYFAAGSADFDTMIAQCDSRDAIVFDTCVWDLRPAERSAIMHVHLAAVWRPQHEPLDVVYARARLSLSAALVRRRVP